MHGLPQHELLMACLVVQHAVEEVHQQAPVLLPREQPRVVDLPVRGHVEAAVADPGIEYLRALGLHVGGGGGLLESNHDQNNKTRKLL